MTVFVFCFFFKQKTAYERRISDWSSDVCSSDLPGAGHLAETGFSNPQDCTVKEGILRRRLASSFSFVPSCLCASFRLAHAGTTESELRDTRIRLERSEEHTSELQSLMRISYAVFCLKKKK